MTDISTRVPAASKRSEAPSASRATIELYQNRTRQLAIRFLLEGGQRGAGPHDADADAFVSYLESRKPEWAVSTWRQYRAACIRTLSDLGHIDAATRLTSISPDGTKKKGVATSATKKKKFPATDRDRLYRWLKSLDHPIATATMHWCEAGVLTGLRPIEWSTAQEIEHPLEGDEATTSVPALLVQNAKVSDIRANGPTRTLRIDQLDAEQLRNLRLHLKTATVMAAQGVFRNFQSQCEEMMREANRALWPRRKTKYTLTSARHQFSANGKRVRSEEEVAALMGHADSSSAGHHYGRRISGEAGSRAKVPVAVEREVATVRRKASRRRGKGRPAARKASKP